MADFRGPASESQRVMQLQKRRERAQEEIEFKRKKLADELKLDKASTGILSEIRTKLRDWAVRQARADCYSQAALS